MFATLNITHNKTIGNILKNVLKIIYSNVSDKKLATSILFKFT